MFLDNTKKMSYHIVWRRCLSYIPFLRLLWSKIIGFFADPAVLLDVKRIVSSFENWGRSSWVAWIYLLRFLGARVALNNLIKHDIFLMLWTCNIISHALVNFEHNVIIYKNYYWAIYRTSLSKKMISNILVYNHQHHRYMLLVIYSYDEIIAPTLDTRNV